MKKDGAQRPLALASPATTGVDLEEALVEVEEHPAGVGVGQAVHLTLLQRTLATILALAIRMTLIPNPVMILVILAAVIHPIPPRHHHRHRLQPRMLMGETMVAMIPIVKGTQIRMSKKRGVKVR